MTTTTTPKWIETLQQFGPCDDSLAWAVSQQDAATAWKNCQRGDWMLWLVGRVLSGEHESDERKRLVLCCCECARLTLPIYTKQYPGDDRVEKCIITTEKWAYGDATIEEVRAARRAAAATAAAYAAATAAAYAAATAAAYADATAAAYAAATAAAYAAATAADDAAAYAAATAAYAATATAARLSTRLSTLAKCANIVRKHYPVSPFKAAKAKLKGPTE